MLRLAARVSVILFQEVVGDRTIIVVITWSLRAFVFFGQPIYFRFVNFSEILKLLCHVQKIQFFFRVTISALTAASNKTVIPITIIT